METKKGIKAYKVTFGQIEGYTEFVSNESFTVLAEDVNEAIKVAEKNLETIARGKTAGKIKGFKYPTEVELLISQFD